MTRPAPRPTVPPHTVLSPEILRISGLSVDYAGDRRVHAVSDVDIVLRRGEILGLAGESGCGKSTLAYAVNRLLRPPAEVVSGSVVFREPDGTEIDVFALDGEPLRRFRWRKIAMVFQSAMNSLNPVLTIRSQLHDVLIAHAPEMSRTDRAARCTELLELVGVDPARQAGYPHELSGGMRQRVMIAMALALEPEIMFLDEPTTALDVVVQRDILLEIDALRERLGFAIVFITHDLSLLLEISDRIVIMYAGRIVEQADTARLLDRPRHPYTIGLLESFPGLTGPRRTDLHGIPGHPPDLAQPIHGCSYAPRCPFQRPCCTERRPVLSSPDGAADLVACHAHDTTTGWEVG